MRAALALGTLVVLLAAASCGESEPTPPGGGPADPEVPADVLSRLRGDESEGHEELRLAVEEVAAGRAAAGSTPRQRVLTAWITLALDDGEIEEAHRAYELLKKENGGVPDYADGSSASAESVAYGIAGAAVEEGRRRAEGPTPDREASERAFAVADRLLAGVGSDPDVESELALARTWAGLRRSERSSWTGLAAIGNFGSNVAPHAGARVLALVDDFALGDTVFLSVLERWAAEGANRNVRVGVLPILTGHVRRGLRREPATPEQESASLDARLAGKPVLREPGSMRPSEATRLGLPSGHVGLVLFDRTGRVVARLSGIAIDPRSLDVVVQRLASR